MISSLCINNRIRDFFLQNIKVVTCKFIFSKNILDDYPVNRSLNQ